MGGLLILTAALVLTLLWSRPDQRLRLDRRRDDGGFGAIGFADDYLKIVRRSHHGLRPRYKFGWQLVVGAAVGILLLALQRKGLADTRLVFPFFNVSSPIWVSGICRSRCSCSSPSPTLSISRTGSTAWRSASSRLP
jgi:phospho-N-acetylmuramoyl-pentapeptide-transferase